MSVAAVQKTNSQSDRAIKAKVRRGPEESRKALVSLLPMYSPLDELPTARRKFIICIYRIEPCRIRLSGDSVGYRAEKVS